MEADNRITSENAENIKKEENISKELLDDLLMSETDGSETERKYLNIVLLDLAAAADVFLLGILPYTAMIWWDLGVSCVIVWALD